MAHKVQAVFWVADLKARNVNVKEYESQDRGNSGVSGKFWLSGTIHVQPKGYIWSMEQKFKVLLTVAEHPESGTIVFQNPNNNNGTAHMVVAAISDYSMDTKVVKLLGRLEFVPAEDRRLASIDNVTKAYLVEVSEGVE